MGICPYRSSCWLYPRADEAAAYRMLKAAYCEHMPERCEINRRYLAGQPVPGNLLPDGTVEG
jgi:hypothetical protein